MEPIADAEHVADPGPAATVDAVLVLTGERGRRGLYRADLDGVECLGASLSTARAWAALDRIDAPHRSVGPPSGPIGGP